MRHGKVLQHGEMCQASDKQAGVWRIAQQNPQDFVFFILNLFKMILGSSVPLLQHFGHPNFRKKPLSANGQLVLY